MYPTPIIYYSIGGTPQVLPGSSEPAPGDSYLEFFKYMLEQTTILQTTLAAVGLDEKDFPKEYATAVCNMFAQLGARGTNVIYASGDDEVGHGGCRAKDGSGKIEFMLTFPATCTCGTSSLLGCSTLTQTQFTDRIVVGSTGPYMTTVAVPEVVTGVAHPARIPNFLRSRRTSPVAAFRITFRALPTRKMLFLGILRALATSITAFTSASSPIT